MFECLYHDRAGKWYDTSDWHMTGLRHRLSPIDVIIHVSMTMDVRGQLRAGSADSAEC